MNAYLTNDYFTVLPLVLAGRATLLAPPYAVKEYVARGALVELDVDWSFKTTIVAVATYAASFSPILAKIIAYAREIGRHLNNESLAG